MSTQGVIDALHCLLELPEFLPCMDVLYDARFASFISFTIHDLIQIGISAKKCSAKRGKGGRSAIVIKNGDAWTAEMFNVLNNGDLPSITRIFDKIDEAIQWLDFPKEELI
jgi:hypothetical protein